MSACEINTATSNWPHIPFQRSEAGAGLRPAADLSCPRIVTRRRYADRISIAHASLAAQGRRLRARQRACRLMAPVKVDPDKVREFKDAESFYKWLGKHHDKEDEVWIKIHKVGSGLKSITPKEAIDVVLCWGWIDAVRKGLRRQELSAALHAARQEEHLEPDQCRQRRPADRGRPDDRARAQSRSRRPRPTGAGTALTRAART